MLQNPWVSKHFKNVWRRNPKSHNSTAHVANASDLNGTATDMVTTTLTSDQYRQLLHLLKTQPSGTNESLDAPTENGATALLAGTVCLLANNTHN